MKVRVFLLLAAIAGALATWLPWQHLGKDELTGWNVGGTLSFVAFVLAGLCTGFRPTWPLKPRRPGEINPADLPKARIVS